MRTTTLFGLVSMLATVLVNTPALAGPTVLAGRWTSPVGELAITQKGSEVTGTLVKPAQGCKLSKNAKVLKGVLLEDNLTGEIEVCQQGDGCEVSAKAFVIFLVTKKGQRMSGALHLPKKTCSVPGMGAGRGLRITKITAVQADKRKPRQRANTRGHEQAKAATSQDRSAPSEQTSDDNIWSGTAWDDAASGAGADAKGQVFNPKLAGSLLADGANLLAVGKAEEAREKFIAATRADPSRAEAYIGVGVSYYLRSKYTDALRWYKDALEANPDFGDSYYNMACIYAIERKKELALKYLRIALLNGYFSLNNKTALLEDPDFANFKDDPDFVALLDSIE